MIERPGYREVLADIMEHFPTRRVLTVRDACDYIGVKDSRTLRKYFALPGKTFTVTELASAIAGGVRRG